MQTTVAAFIVFAIVVAAMAVGVIFNRKPIKGSCGGIGAGSCACDNAGKPRGSCDN